MLDSFCCISRLDRLARRRLTRICSLPMLCRWPSVVPFQIRMLETIFGVGAIGSLPVLILTTIEDFQRTDQVSKQEVETEQPE